MLSKRIHAWEASWYRYLQPLKAVGTRGAIGKTPPAISDKIFDKPQPPRVQWPQNLAGILTGARSTTGVIRGRRL